MVVIAKSKLVESFVILVVCPNQLLANLYAHLKLLPEPIGLSFLEAYVGVLNSCVHANLFQRGAAGRFLLRGELMVFGVVI